MPTPERAIVTLRAAELRELVEQRGREHRKIDRFASPDAVGHDVRRIVLDDYAVTARALEIRDQLLHDRAQRHCRQHFDFRCIRAPGLHQCDCNGNARGRCDKNV